jgi:probable dihydroxyacetone kinase regulator
MGEAIQIGARYVLALSIKDLANYKSLDKISVCEIVSNCGAGRQTFYNHFNNKYDLINWIYESSTRSIRNKFFCNEKWDKVIGMLLLHIKENQPFYVNAFNNEEKDIFINFVIKNTSDAYKKLIKRRVGEKTLSDELAFAIDFYSYSAVYSAKRWSEKKMIEPPECLANKIYKNMPPELRKWL